MITESFLKQLRVVNIKQYISFIQFLDNYGEDFKNCVDTSTSDLKFRNYIESWLNTFGYTFSISYDNEKNKVYYGVYKDNIFVDGMVQELESLSNLKTLYLNCINNGTEK